MTSESKGTEAKVDDIKTVYLEHGSKISSCKVSLQGATVVSWQIAKNELLFVSSKAFFKPGKAIRGGVPVVFPQFGPGALPQHGFARNNLWTHKETLLNKTNGDVTSSFVFSDTEATRKVWDYAFQLVLTIVLKSTSLSMQLAVTNLEKEKSFSFTTLLHTYFRSSIGTTTVTGLQGITYIDKLQSAKAFEEKDKAITFSGELDRVYKDCGNKEIFIGDGGNADVALKRTGFRDVVVWNPWIAKSKTMEDFAPEEYKEMVCVEAGSVAEPVTLEAGKTWEGAQGMSLRILDDGSAKKSS